MLSFRRIESSDPVVNFLYELIQARLDDNQSVLWLVPGGSAIAIAVAVSERLKAGTGEYRLAVSLTDERYGTTGHEDSNWRQLQEAGFLLSEADLHPVLFGASMSETAEAYERWLEHSLRTADFTIGFFGIGSDGHTSGILPHSAALQAPGLVAAYDGGAYQRITTTAQAIAQLDVAVLYAMGESKRPVLEGLQIEIDVAEQPVQILKQVPELYIFSDQVGETV